MPELPSISAAEWRVVEILWESSPRTSYEIVMELEGQEECSSQTIKTMLHRLVKKGVLDFEKSRREYRYFPLLKKESYVESESDSFLARVFNGAAAPMFAHFVKNKKMTADEIAEIKKILGEIEAQERK